MGLEALAEVAQKNLDTRFVQNPCRGIVLGLDEEGRGEQLCWIMGRRPNSQNRVYVADGDQLRTEPADPSKVEDPRLIIYSAMDVVSDGKSSNKGYIVSNGAQTTNLVKFMRFNSNVSFYRFMSLLGSSYCEPDAPIFTPRITGLQSSAESGNVFMSLLRADPEAKRLWSAEVERAKSEGVTPEVFGQEGQNIRVTTQLFNRAIGARCGLDYERFPTVRSFFELPVRKGFGYCLTTYKPGNPQGLDSFEGEPFAVPLRGDLEGDIMPAYWNRLESEWRVALGGRRFSFDNGEVYMAPPINRFSKVGG